MTEAQPTVVTELPVVTFRRASGDELHFGELDPAFTERLGIAPGSWDRPFRVQLEAKISKRGNTFFNYEQAKVPFPDGLDTQISVNGVVLESGEVGLSQRGNQRRQLSGAVELEGHPFVVTAYISETKDLFWVKVHLQVQKSVTPKADAAAPQGGRFV